MVSSFVNDCLGRESFGTKRGLLRTAACSSTSSGPVLLDRERALSRNSTRRRGRARGAWGIDPAAAWCPTSSSSTAEAPERRSAPAPRGSVDRGDVAAVDAQVGAVDVAGERAREEGDGDSHLLGGSHATERVGHEMLHGEALDLPPVVAPVSLLRDVAKDALWGLPLVPRPALSRARAASPRA